MKGEEERGWRSMIGGNVGMEYGAGMDGMYRRGDREKAGWEITPILISKSQCLWFTMLMAGVAFAQR